jgi:hypothetical protein
MGCFIFLPPPTGNGILKSKCERHFIEHLWQGPYNIWGWFLDLTKREETSVRLEISGEAFQSLLLGQVELHQTLEFSG